MSNELRILGDNPYTIEGRDPLGFDDFVNSLVDITINSKESAPFTIGIQGDWGTGKTTVMKRMQRKLEDSDCLTIWFDPWKYTEKEEVWRGLIKTVFDKFPPNIINKIIENKKEIFIKSMDKITEILGAGKLISEMESIFKLDTKFINEFEDIMESLIFEYLKKEEKNLLVIFVDDLDRCKPECAIKILEAIKLYLCVSNCIFVIGFDRDVIDKGIEIIYGKDSKVSGTEYIKKIIQLPFRVPKPGEKEIKNYTEICIEELGAKEIFSENGEIKSEYIDTIVQGTNSNPREIKRFLNPFVLLHNVKKDKIPGYDPKKLIYILLIQLRWFHVFKAIDRDKTLMIKLQEYIGGNKETKENLKDGLKELLEQKDFLTFSEENIPKFKDEDELSEYLVHSMLPKIEEKKPKIPTKKEEWIHLLLSDVNEFNRARAETGDIQIDLSGADLREADLRGAYLTGANLREANLREARLKRADLREATLWGADLWGANLRGVTLQRADLWGATLREADLREADLREAVLEDIRGWEDVFSFENTILIEVRGVSKSDLAYAEKRGAIISRLKSSDR